MNKKNIFDEYTIYKAYIPTLSSNSYLQDKKYSKIHDKKLNKYIIQYVNSQFDYLGNKYVQITNSLLNNSSSLFKNLIGIIHGKIIPKTKYEDSYLLIYFMNVRQDERREGINSSMIKYAKQYFNINNVEFDKPTWEGQKFISLGK